MSGIKIQVESNGVQLNNLQVQCFLGVWPRVPQFDPPENAKDLRLVAHNLTELLGMDLGGGAPSRNVFFDIIAPIFQVFLKHKSNYQFSVCLTTVNVIFYNIFIPPSPKTKILDLPL